MTTTGHHPDLDELAVTMVAVDGMRMHLRGRDRDEAIRRMHGRIDTELIAWRLYITTRTVHRVIARSLPARVPSRNHREPAKRTD